MRRNLRRKLRVSCGSILVAAVLFLLPFLTGCSVQDEAETTECRQLTLWHYWENGRMQAALRKLVNEYNESQDQVEIRMKYIPDEDYKKQLALSMADDLMPDLAIVDVSNFQYFHAMRPFVDLTDEIEGIEDMTPEAKEACLADGRMMGMPIGVNCSVLYYNKELLSEVGAEVPRTVDDIVDIADQFTGREEFGFVVSAVQSEENIYSFLPMLWASGGDIDSLNSPQSRKAFGMLRNMAESGAMSRQAINLNAGDLVKRFAQENIVMLSTTSVMIDTIREMNPELDFDFTLPEDESGNKFSVLGGEIFAVPDGENQEEAIEFLRFLNQGERMRDFESECGYLSVRRDVLETQYADDPLKKKEKDAFEHCRAREYSEQWPRIAEVFTETVEAEIIGAEDEQVILDAAAERIRKIREDER